MSISVDEFPPLVREFAFYKQTIQNCSVKTVDEYLTDMRTFLRYMSVKRARLPVTEENLEAADISYADLDFFASVQTMEIYEYLMYVKRDRENQVCARSRKLSSIRSFYKYLTVKAHKLDRDPTVGVETPKKPQNLPKFLSVEESVALLTAVREDESSDTAERDFCILTLFLNCGMRLSELCGIDLTDIDPELRSLRVFGKGSKERVIYLNAACKSALEEYLPIRAEQKPKAGHENALFISREARRISDKTVQWMVKKYLSAAGLGNKDYSTHKLRHTAATLMYQSGQVDIRVLKDILGHAQLNTTQIYTHVSNKGMEEAMAHNPLADMKIGDTESDEEGGEEEDEE